jgi:hydrophobic/amphiphilic exporter-1 (mainly G- bacteria), HAE1 family
MPTLVYLVPFGRRPCRIPAADEERGVMSWLTRISLRSRSVVALVVIAIVVIGAFGVSRLQQELMPSIEYPALTIFTVQAGASPADIERGVTIPLETGLKAVTGIKELTSYSSENVSVIVALFEFGTDMGLKQTAVQQVVERMGPALPTGSQPQIKAINFGDFPVMQLAVTSQLPPAQLAAMLQQKVLPQLQQIPGVGDVSLSGVEGSRVKVDLKPAEIMASGVSIQAIMATLSAANVSMPVGTVGSEGTTIPVRVTSVAATLKALESLPVKTGSLLAQTANTSASTPAAPVTLGQVATLSVVPAPVTSLTRTNGQPSIGISLTKSSNGNVVNISKEVNKLIPGFQATLGSGTVITTVVDQAPTVTKSISSMWREGLLGALFAVLVILLFLGSWRSTIVAGVSIPLSVLVALVVMWAGGTSLNVITLAGLTIAIGRVIDDSIVVLENSYRHLQEGDDPMKAAYSATREVASAVTASTLTTVAVFLPLAFVGGMAAEFFRPFALTVTYALVASLLVSLTVVPVFVTWLLTKGHVGHRDGNKITRLQRAYLPILRLAVSHKLITAILAIAIFGGSMLAIPFLKTNLIDDSQATAISITQTLPPGTDITATSQAAAGIETLLAKTQGIETYQVTIGSTGNVFSGGGSSSTAQFTVTPNGERSRADLMADIRTGVSALTAAGTVTVAESSSMGFAVSDISVRIQADDATALKEASDVVVRALTAIPGLTNVSSNLSASRAQLTVNVDPAKAAAAGLDATQVGQYVALVLTGIPAGTVVTESGPLAAVITVPMSVSGGAEQLGALPITGSAGLVPLSSVAEVVEVMEPTEISRTDGARTVTVSATDTSGNVGAASNSIKTALSSASLPTGARWDLAGATEEMTSMFSSLMIAMLVAIMLVYLIMVGTFRSLLSPLILLVSIPFAAVGAVLLLLVTQISLSMPSLIGLLMLIGIVVTNAIVLLDLIEQFRKQGMDARSAVTEGARRRLRPILMTAAATILALAPMALGLGEGAFLSKPLAVVVIGGLVTSTMLTLIIVPVLYLIAEKLRKRREPPEVQEPAPE